MATEFKLPNLGENIESGDVVKVLVSAGDEIQADQTVMELETDKAAIEVPSPVGGVVREVHVKAGDIAKVGQLILTIDEGGDGKASGAEKAAAKKPAAPKPEAEESPEKAGEGGRPPPETAEPEPKALKKAPPAPEEEQTAEAPAGDGRGAPVPAPPSVRRLAREIGVDIAEVRGSGKGGRISEKDVKAHAKVLLREAASGPAPTPAGVFVELPDFSQWGPVERKAMSGVRKATASHVARAWSAIPHVTQCDKADITELEKLRKQHAKKAEARGGKLTVTAIVLKLIVSALKKFPEFNASIDPARNEIIYKKYYHIGIAVDTDRGLLVPVIRDVDRKNILDLSVELNEAAERARSGKTALEEMQGGTFTITNLGGIGGTYFTPIVNHPEVAILGVSRGSWEPVHRNGQFEPRLLLPLSLSYDHRVIDGAAAARFLRWVAEALATPFLASLEG